MQFFCQPFRSICAESNPYAVIKNKNPEDLNKFPGFLFSEMNFYAKISVKMNREVSI